MHYHWLQVHLVAIVETAPHVYVGYALMELATWDLDSYLELVKEDFIYLVSGRIVEQELSIGMTIELALCLSCHCRCCCCCTVRCGKLCIIAPLSMWPVSFVTNVWCCSGHLLFCSAELSR